MKRTLSLIAAILAMLMLASCGANNEDETLTGENDTTVDTTETTEDTAGEEIAYTSAEELLVTLMNGYNENASEETMLYVAGGNSYNFDTVKMDAPAKFVALADTDYDENLGYPAADAGKLDDAASMFNMMNINTFNCAAFHFADSSDVDAMVEPLKNNIMARQWICGSPEKLYIAKLPGDYLVMAWGVASSGGIIDNFAASIAITVADADIVVNETIGAE
ncbi:MAG: hypothetical protein E7658_06045 [Ruminococcaceae bacterium]|nr:hypothetical protein [Oscillospiraceae bacterium]